MKELSRRSLMDVRGVIHGQNYVNIKARLVQYLPSEYANTFANVKFYEPTGIWYVDDELACFRLKDASPAEKDEAAAWLEECRNYIGSTIADKMPYWRSLFTIPTEEQIFLYRNASGDIRVVLSEWGFEPKGPGQKIDVIGILIDAPRLTKQEDVTIHIDYSDGTVAQDQPFSLTAFKHSSISSISISFKISLAIFCSLSVNSREFIKSLLIASEKSDKILASSVL